MQQPDKRTVSSLNRLIAEHSADGFDIALREIWLQSSAAAQNYELQAKKACIAHRRDPVLDVQQQELRQLTLATVAIMRFSCSACVLAWPLLGSDENLKWLSIASIRRFASVALRPCDNTPHSLQIWTAAKDDPKQMHTHHQQAAQRYGRQQENTFEKLWKAVSQPESTEKTQDARNESVQLVQRLVKCLPALAPSSLASWLVWLPGPSAPSTVL
jgi:hypothetical protein